MKNFDEAQKLFGSFEIRADFHKLRDSLDVLEDLIEEQGEDLQRATRLKEKIGKYLEAESERILQKSNVRDLNLNGAGEIANVLDEALDEEDVRRLLQIVSIKKKYFGDPDKR